MPTDVLVPPICPRCQGRLLPSRDSYGAYSSCLCCGFVHDWLHGPAITMPDDALGSGRRRRQPSHGHARL